MCVCCVVCVCVTCTNSHGIDKLLPPAAASHHQGQVCLLDQLIYSALHAYKNPHTQAHKPHKKTTRSKKKTTKAQKARAHTPRPPGRPGETRPTSVLMYTERSKCFRLAKAHLERKDFLTMTISAKFLLINTMELAVRLPEKVRKKDSKRSSFFVKSNKGCGRKES